MSDKKAICIYTDPDFEIDGGNIFVSMPYEDSRSFENNNKDMKLLVSYSLDHLLDKWGILNELNSAKKIKAENKKLRESLEKYANPDNWDNVNYPNMCILEGDCKEVNHKNTECAGGEIARQTLKELEGEK